jgi:Flp pilus assembly protein TadD
VHFNLCVCHYRLGRNAKAVSELRTAIALKRGDYPRALYALGMARLAQQNWREARLAFLAVVSARQADGEAWFDLAFAYLGERDLGGAETAFRNAVLYGTVDADLVHNNIGVILALRGDLSTAVKEFETALTLSGGRLAEAKTNLEVCRRLGRSARLVAQLEFGNRQRPPGNA